MATTTTTTTKLTTTTATTARLTISTTTTTTTTKTYDSVAKIFLGEKRGNICRKFYAGKSLTDAKKVKNPFFFLMSVAIIVGDEWNGTHQVFVVSD